MNDNTASRQPTEPARPAATAVSEDVSPDFSTVEVYAKAKQAIGRDLHYLRELLQKRDSQRRDARCRDLMAKLAEDHFTLAVLGQFKRGKSSLMNAVIGRALLPTGVLPLTSAITVLRFGPRERFVVEREGSIFPEDVPLSRLAEYVTEKGNPGNEKRVSRARIEIPSPFLRRGLEFVDTPGVGSAIEANTAITRGFLPQCDAVIFITSVDSPLSKTETDFLGEIREHVRKIFFVVNKIDLLGETERDEVLQFVSQNLRRIAAADSVRIFPLSCQRALDAKIRGDAEGFARSGLKAFEETLSRFLSTEKMSAFLVSILDRAIAVMDEELREIEIEARAREIPKEELQANMTALRSRFDHLRASREHDLSTVRRRVRALIQQTSAQETRAILNREKQNLKERIAQEIARAPWRLARAVAKRLGAEIAKRLNASLEGWAKSVLADIWPLCEKLLREELQPVIKQLRAIPESAAQVFKLEATGLQALAEFEEIAVERNGRSPYPRRFEWKQRPSWLARMREWGPKPPGQKMQSPPAMPIRLRFSPLFLAGDSLREYLVAELERMLDMSETAVCDAVLARTDETLDKTISQARFRAEEVEKHVVATIAGRKPSASRPPERESLAQQRERLTELRARMTLLRNRIVESETSVLEVVSTSPLLVETEIPAPEAPPAAAPPPILHDADIAKDLETRGCPACNRTYKAMFDFFAHLQYELYGNEGGQNTYAAEGGLCPLHTWQLAAVASPQGISQGYPGLVERVARKVSRLSSTDGELGKSVLALIQNTGGCRACRELRTSESAYLERLSAFLQTAQGRAAYDSSQGLCLRHLGLLLAADLSQEVKTFLLRHASRRLTMMAEDMQSFTLKRDALRRSLYNQDEDDAYMRALVHLAGARYLAVPWKTDEEET